MPSDTLPTATLVRVFARHGIHRLVGSSYEHQFKDAELPIELLSAFGLTYRRARVDYDSAGSPEALLHHYEKGTSPHVVTWREGLSIHTRRQSIEERLAGKPLEKFVLLSELLKFLVMHHTEVALRDTTADVVRALKKHYAGP